MRSHLLPLNFAVQPPRAIIHGECNGEAFTTQGVMVCEQKSPSAALVSVKVPPLEGRVVYSNGELKRTDDFNWYPKEGFWLWKKKPIKDLWLDLDLGEVAATFGDWPVALDVSAQGKDGVVTTRGILYHRICNDADIPCSKLEVSFMCAGSEKTTGPSRIGKCVRMAGSPQAFEVKLTGSAYHAGPGAVLYVQAPRAGVALAYDVTPDDFSHGVVKVDFPAILTGPTLIGMRLAWKTPERQAAETRVLIVGHDPDWTGLDQPHVLNSDWVRPFLANLFEVDLYQGRDLIKRSFTDGKSVNDFPSPKDGQVACGFAWSRDSSDLTALCLDYKSQEVKVP